MKQLATLLTVLVSLSACGACAKAPPPVATVFAEKKVDRSLAIFTAYGSGHGCAVRGDIFTAAHVMRVARQDINRASWSDSSGKFGYAQVVVRSTAKDLVVLHNLGLGSGPEYHKLANPARAGDPVFWVEYDFSEAKLAFDPVFRTAVVQKRIAQHYILSETPVQGASGGCLFNAAGDVLGVMAWGLTMYNGEKIGAAVEILPEDLHQ